jgi:hypothetical protein
MMRVGICGFRFFSCAVASSLISTGWMLYPSEYNVPLSTSSSTSASAPRIASACPRIMASKRGFWDMALVFWEVMDGKSSSW